MEISSENAVDVFASYIPAVSHFPAHSTGQLLLSLLDSWANTARELTAVCSQIEDLCKT